MSARSTSQDVRTRSVNGQSYVVENADTTYAGSMTSLKAGYLRPYQGTAGEQPVGRAIVEGSVLGDTSASPKPTQSVAMVDEIVEAVAVSGASTIADVGKVVYLNDTDDLKADLTLTRPTRGIPYGVIEKFNSSTSFDVLRFGRTTLLAMQGTGTREMMPLGTFANAALINGNIATAIVMPFHGKFVSLHGMVETAFTGSGGTADINLEIGGTNVTGGVLTVSTAAGGTIGTKLDATAITAANEFNEGSTVDVEVANTGGTQTAGSVRLYAIVERLPGL